MKTVLITERDDHWLVQPWASAANGNDRDIETLTPECYLSNATGPDWRNARIYNLCRSYSYQSMGYYVSLLAEAWGHRPIPDVMTIQDLSRNSALRLIPQDLDELIQKSLAPLTSNEFVLSIYFGQNLAKRYDKLTRELFSILHAPLLRFRFARKDDRWRMRAAATIALSDVPKEHHAFVSQAAQKYFGRRSTNRSKRKKMRYDLAILHNPDEQDLAPSDPTALKRLVKAAAAQSVAAELITWQDADRLLEFDALFVRETTAVGHHTYRLARRAEAAGMAVIDDPLSILRCTNKVYLGEILQRAKIATPRTYVLHKGNYEQIAETVVYPCVLKRPDSQFSQGVTKANDRDEMLAILKTYFTDSELVIAQEFMKTDFDWRIGVLDGRAIFACKYHMARGHWQIAKHESEKKTRFGNTETLPVELAPRKCVAMAVKASELIGDGLYGVDIKESDGQFYVIEVNDNPNIDSGVEDQVLRDELYRRIVESFVRRIERNKFSQTVA